MTKTESIKENGNDKVKKEKKQRLRNKHTTQWAHSTEPSSYFYRCFSAEVSQNSRLSWLEQTSVI